MEDLCGGILLVFKCHLRVYKAWIESDNYLLFFFQTDPSARNMRNKSWPYYKDWEIIFGKDRAAGDVAKAWQDMTKDDVYRPVPVEQTTTLDQEETASVNTGGKHGEGSSSMRSCKRKRPQVVEVQNTPTFELMSSFFTEVSSQIGSLVSKVGSERDAKGQRQNLVKELAKYPLSLEDRLTVVKRICASAEDVDIFYGLGEEERAAMVSMVLQNTW